MASLSLSRTVEEPPPRQDEPQPTADSAATRVLVLSTAGFTLMFAVWLMFGILGVPIQKELGLSDPELAWISAVAVLNGSAQAIRATVEKSEVAVKEGA